LRRKQESGLEEEKTRIWTRRGGKQESGLEEEETRIWTRRGGKQESGLEEEETRICLWSAATWVVVRSAEGFWLQFLCSLDSVVVCALISSSSSCRDWALFHTGVVQSKETIGFLFQTLELSPAFMTGFSLLIHLPMLSTR
jgi:hypothetical protein